MQVMFILQPPLYQVKQGKRAIYLDTDAELKEWQEIVILTRAKHYSAL